MSLFAFILIILSAGFHASWNLLAKKTVMTFPFYTIICMVSACMWLHVQLWTPVPIWSLPAKFWLCIVLTVSSDVLYCMGLVKSYRYFDMSTAYPMMRSLPLLLTAIITTVFALGKPLTPLAMFGMFVVFCGCMSMPLKKFSDFNVRNYITWNMFFIFLTACGTTGYTIADSQGQKVIAEYIAANNISVAKPVLSMSYYSTRGIFLSSTLFITAMFSKEQRGIFFSYFRKRDWTPFAAGVFASLTYILVLIAMNFVTNVSYVQVFRQIGLILGLAMGVFILKEKCTVTKVVGVALILFGLALTVI